MVDTQGDSPLEGRMSAEIPRLRAYVARLLGVRTTSPDAEDALQEVLARAWRYRASFEEERALGPWLRRAALRVVLDRREARDRAPRSVELDPAEVPARASVDSASQREQVERMLSPLSPIEREVLLRFHQREESVGEIARLLSLPEGTVKSHLWRARRRIAERGREQ
jgi:RNA polymerase sigma-70 factor (ECF subfamily)